MVMSQSGARIQTVPLEAVVLTTPETIVQRIDAGAITKTPSVSVWLSLKTEPRMSTAFVVDVNTSLFEKKGPSTTNPLKPKGMYVVQNLKQERGVQMALIYDISRLIICSTSAIDHFPIKSDKE